MKYGITLDEYSGGLLRLPVLVEETLPQLPFFPFPLKISEYFGGFCFNFAMPVKGVIVGGGASTSRLGLVFPLIS